MKLALWNVQWNESERRRRFIHEVLKGESPDVFCLTEATNQLTGKYPNSISSIADYGYRSEGNRRKVWLSSKSKWSDVEYGDGIPPGRFVSGITSGIRFVGICVPWFNAHVRDGNKNRERWEDHIAFLEGLGPILQKYAKSSPVCVLGDFNQRIPAILWNQKYLPILHAALGVEYKIQTEAILDCDGEKLIDHIATTKELGFKVTQTISRVDESGARVSDHPGIIGTLGFC